MDEPNVTIRQLVAVDIEIFQRIRLEALRLEPASFHSSYEDWAALTDDDWQQRLNSPVFAALLDEATVGMMGLIQQRTKRTAHRGDIVMVYVRNDLRGTGLAARLLDTVSAHALEIGIRQLELGVSADNPAARRFYERAGFREVGRIPGGFIHEGREIDDILMAKRLI
jgi:RimJ/RimL family protein N-acetyltransferase